MCVNYNDCEKCLNSWCCTTKEFKPSFHVCSDFDCYKYDECTGRCLGIDEDYFD